jgi:hypothetical protein
MIGEIAELSRGPWPRGLEVLIFKLDLDWKLGLSPARHDGQIEYHEGVIRIARGLQKTVRLVQRQ